MDLSDFVVCLRAVQHSHKQSVYACLCVFEANPEYQRSHEPLPLEFNFWYDHLFLDNTFSRIITNFRKLKGIFHLVALLLFTVEYHLYIKKNVLTKDELESGWLSTHRSHLSWSFYLLCISLGLIALNILLVYASAKIKNSTSLELNATLVAVDTCLIAANPHNNAIDYQQIEDVNFKAQKEPVTVGGGLRSSKKVKKIIDFVY